MKKVFIWFLLSMKRYMKRLSFLAVLLLLPLLAALLGNGNSGDQKIQIAVCVLGQENELGNRLAESLVLQSGSEGGGMFHFYQCRDENEVRDDVAAKRAECGYVIYEGLEEKLNQKAFKRSIGVITAPSTVTASLSTETVFAALAELYDQMLLETYTATGQAFETLGEAGSKARLKAADRAGELYEKWLQNGSTFSFSYSYVDGEKAEEEPLSVFPVRGLTAVFVFITGLYSGVVLCMDEERGLFQTLDYRLRLPCRLACLSAPVALAMASGLLALWTGRAAGQALGEILRMLCYGLAVIIFSWVLKAVCRKPQVLCCLIPFLMIGSLIFCPVFLDIGQLAEGPGQIGKLFLPYYYLKGF